MTDQTRPERLTTDSVEEEINLLELLQVIARRKMLIVKLCVVAAVLSAVISLCLPNIYTATAKVLPPQKDGGGGLSALLSQAGGLAALAGSSLGLGGSSELYVGILKSRSVADAVIKRFTLEKEFKTRTPDETRKALDNIVRIQAGKDGIITIAADSKSPQLAANIANAMVDELGRKSVQLNLSKAGSERLFLEKRLSLVKDDLKRAEEDLKQFAERNKAIKVEAQATASIEGIARLRAEIVSKEVQLESLRSYQTDEAPEVKALQAGIAKLRSQLSSLAGGGKSSDAILNVGTVPNLGLEYARKMRELRIQEAIFEQLTKQYEVAKLNEAKDSSTLQVLDEAVVPIKKSKPKRSLMIIMATITAFFAGVFAVFVQEYISKMSDQDRHAWQEIKTSLRFSKGRN
jgi:uncharacterized protein involved in exopolysaccharide biosynthesis